MKSPIFIRSNFLGTEFNLWDHGENPKRSNNLTKIREQIGVIMYVRCPMFYSLLITFMKESNLLGARGPRKMKVMIPEVKSTGEVYQFKPMNVYC